MEKCEKEKNKEKLRGRMMYEEKAIRYK